jgi:hypothetical protein
MSGRDAASQGLPEEAAGEYAAPVPAPSYKPEAGITFHSQRVEPDAPIRPGSPDEELKGLAYKPVELAPHEPLSLPPTDEARGDKKQRASDPSRSLSGMREVGRVESSPEYEELRREFRIVEPALASQSVRFGSVASLVQNRSGEKSDRGAGSHWPVTSQGEPRPRDGATEEPRETPPPGLTRPASPVNEPAFEPISHERFKTEARSYGGITANAGETPPNDAQRPHRAPMYQEHGARVTINQLDIQIINQQPPMPPQPASRTPRTGGDTQNEIDRRLLGRFGLNA